ncbi:MAG: HU family DNA-binding protein [Chloroflexia bacterium]|nr:HU family DNA-binding protein [Chloroflexia bacterium]
MPGKTEIVNQVSERTGLKKTEVQQVVDETLNEIRSSLESGDSVTLRGFGNFKVTERSARKGRNPRTGEEIEIAAGKRVSFKMSK